MRMLLLSLFLVCSFAATALAQNEEPADDLKSLVETERAFSHASEEQGTSGAFAAFIADEGILFRPTAVSGKKWMREHPVPESATRSLLTWQPVFAYVSRAGDLGYTTGPWQFKKDIKDARPSAFGNFMTVWKRQTDGSWKFALDLGISNPDPKTAMHPPSGEIRREKHFKTVDRVAARASLLSTEREFSKASADQGARDAFLQYAANDVRLFRNDHFPYVGKMAAADSLAPMNAEWTWTPSFGDVSVSGDLGYSYGIYELKDKNGSVTEHGNFARVWKKVNDAWKLVVDVADPLPPGK